MEISIKTKHYNLTGLRFLAPRPICKPLVICSNQIAGTIQYLQGLTGIRHADAAHRRGVTNGSKYRWPGESDRSGRLGGGRERRRFHASFHSLNSDGRSRNRAMFPSCSSVSSVSAMLVKRSRSSGETMGFANRASAASVGRILSRTA